ncbi:hypothetical protein [Larkinella terrae]|uniref:Uncharacterized protein n=1 Tax=Larkinella terrae TaxID=2025311 RepID=A0A7K0EJX8_9BACT|nr:hypothetical protein [Larkinella terrae]MRS61748.1 hypothetical protein [Larkinella terrae]
MKMILSKVADWFWTLLNHRRLIKFYKAELMKPYEVRIQELQLRHDEMIIKHDSPILRIMAGGFIKAMKNLPAENYMVLTFDDGVGFYDVTVQRKMGETPLDQLTAAKKRIAELERQLKATEP